MSSSVESRGGTRSWPRTVLVLVAVAVASLVLGGLTSYAQGGLPSAVTSFANSGSGWTVLTAALVWLVRERTLPSAVLGAVSFVTLVLGYTLISELRGFPYSPVFFGVIGLLVGPFVGVAASWLRHRGRRAALGAGLLAGIAVGDGWHGLVRVLATTGWFYWTLIAVVGLALLAFVLARRVTRPVDALLGVVTTAVVAAALYVGYDVLGS